MKNGLITCARMRECEVRAMASGRVSGAELMERAGTGVVAALSDLFPDLHAQPGRALVLCGPGNNGGDGFVIARLLHARGWQVSVLFHGCAGGQGEDAASMRDRWEELGPVVPLDAASVAAALPADLVIDAVFGAGRVRAPDGVLAAAFARVRAAPAPVVAVDAPSGLCLDSGFYPGVPRDLVPGHALCADLTVTFHRARPGHHLGHGPDVCGRLVVADIGLPEVPPDAAQLVAPGAAELRLLCKGQGHKFAHGSVLVLSGPAHASGAARLAARAALRAGAGLVTLGAAPGDLATLVPALEAVMLRGVVDGAALGDMLARDHRINALCLGPGLGLGPREAGLVAAALESRRPAVLDADALTLLARDDSLRECLHPACILTPHEGEFARLAPDLVPRLAPDESAPLQSRADAARELAARFGVTVLLKGRASVIAAPSGALRIHSAAYGREMPWLATAGAGDVLAGLIAGLLARGFEPVEAVSLAAFLHVEAARAFGPGLIASDLPDMIPHVLKGLCPPGPCRADEAPGRGQGTPISSPPA